MVVCDHETMMDSNDTMFYSMSGLNIFACHTTSGVLGPLPSIFSLATMVDTKYLF